MGSGIVLGLHAFGQHFMQPATLHDFSAHSYCDCTETADVFRQLVSHSSCILVYCLTFQGQEGTLTTA